MSPESTSPLFPDRPIRPLPKRRLRERLPSDVADNITFPPSPQTSAPLFDYPYNTKDDPSLLGAGPSNVASRENMADMARLGHEAGYRRNVLSIDHHDNSLIGQARRALGSRGFHEPTGHGIRTQRQGQARHTNPLPPSSTASSADGYDSFENTNNKKKRKIPTAGETILNGMHVLNDPAAFGVPSPPTTGDEGPGDASGPTSTPYYQTGGSTTNGQGISGPGRGRYGRIRNGRSPLRALSDANGNWSGPNHKLRPGSQYPSPPPENSGIISTAIASAEKVPVPQGQENISLLQRQTSAKPFTFTFDPQNPVSWPGSDPAPSNLPGVHRTQQGALPGDYNRGGGRAARIPSGPAAAMPGSGAEQTAAAMPAEGAGKGGNGTTATPKKPKRRGNSLAIAAKQRRKETEYQNLHHPPAPEDMWICEFCEYERIFGRPPEALIRQYEVKDRRRRREEAERRRLLEKAKMKSRKGKKANKVPAKNNSTTTDRNGVSANDQPPPLLPPPPNGQEEIHDIPSEDFGPDDPLCEDTIPGGEASAMLPDDGYALPPSKPLNSGSANPNATTAAASAFMSASNQKPNTTLSSAAAAAALRARPHTPTNVAEVQTKRTARRSASVSSSRSSVAAVGRSNGRLERRGSSASMTERTFRSPSPHRASAAQTTEQQPPVPQIPASHRRSASSNTHGVGMQNFQTASQKMSAGHPSWYTQPSGDTSKVRTSDAPMRAIKSPPPRPMSASMSSERSDSRNSFNFSYPFHAQSPPGSPTTATAPQWDNPPPRSRSSPPRSSRASISSLTGGKSKQDMVYDPNSRRMVPKANVDAAVEPRVREAAEKQPRRKNKAESLPREGSRLARGTVARVQGTTVDDDKKERKEQRQQTRSPEAQSSRASSAQSLSPAPGAEQRTISPSPRALGKRPSIVPEEPEDPDEIYANIDAPGKPSQNVLHALDAVPTRQTRFEDSRDSQPQHQHSSADALDQYTTGPTLEQIEHLAPVQQETKPVVIENKPITELSKGNGTVRRSSSNSPARQARFATYPSGSLVVRHAPLPRSASPIKSALKRNTGSPTPRELSPSERSTDLSSSRGASPNQREEPGVPRKKSARVSFDDQNIVIVGEAANGDIHSPVPLSPQQAKRPWYSSIGRGKKKDYVLEDDEIMKPRPELPSFGSVREKKAREPEERPLVRPHDPTYSPAMPSSPELRPQSSSTLGETEITDGPVRGQSSDLAIGSLLAQEQNARNEANTSRLREPLPPVVTSIEGNGYYSSDSMRSSDSEEDRPESAMGTSDAEVIPSTQNTEVTQPESHEASQNGLTTLDENLANENEQAAKSVQLSPQIIPEISVIQPSPMASEHVLPLRSSSRSHYFGVPGGFPDDEFDEHYDPHPEPQADGATHEDSSSVPAHTILEPTAAVHPAQTESLPQTTLATTAPVLADDDKSTDGSEGSIYSDAYEDISDAEGDGFMSLNAVVESPVSRDAPSQIPELPGSTLQQTYNQDPESLASSQIPIPYQPSTPPPQDPNDWAQAKVFWRSLTAEKRRELERETVEDAGTEGDREEVAQPIRRNGSKKKSTEQKQSAKQVTLQPHPGPEPPVAVTPSSSDRKVNPDRVYMIQPGSQATHEPIKYSPEQPRMRTSLRAEQPAKGAQAQSPSGMRRTMRSNGQMGQANQQPARRTTMRPEQPEPNQQPAHRTTMRPDKPEPSVSKPSQARVAKPRPQMAPSESTGSPRPKQSKPALQRRGSDASDSSFRRSRAVSGEGFNFRRTMRQSSAPQSPVEPGKGSGRLSLRSLSPAGSQFRRSSITSATSGPPVSMKRRTLRSNSESSPEGKRSSMRFPSFGRSSKEQSSNRSKRPSRLGGSSDEDEGPVSGFRSRFDDSSDEEDARPASSGRAGPLSKGTLRGSNTAPTTFNRSAPIPEKDEDSPELPDSDDDEMPSPLRSPQSRAAAATAVRAGLVRSSSSAIGTSTLSRPGIGGGGPVPSDSTPAMYGRDRRHSFMGILRRNKKSDRQLNDIRRDQPSSPKLQKRSALKRGDSWPLPELEEGEGTQRPNTAGRLLSQSNMSENVQRPGLSGRRSVSLGLPPAQDQNVGNVTGDGLGQRKKKKFGALRRMFKLDD
ncbi:Uu.00g114180.m01.CDS01 [Anthostomella pinea]|uniref:Uu.00g114180.m01.CDS01 n=1 Tax=Anthostomella pinea TaxID=933095 RepID=A0AAI8VFJ8_9PEZI|nr:Uu.00g114180.m01.CDS01 [Anthostomella pinea]